MTDEEKDRYIRRLEETVDEQQEIIEGYRVAASMAGLSEEIRKDEHHG